MKEQGLNFMETLFILDNLGVEKVSVKALIGAFYKEPTREEQAAALRKEVKQELPELPPLPEPPKPPQGPRVFDSYKEAKKDAKKGQETVFDKELGGFVNV